MNTLYRTKKIKKQSIVIIFPLLGRHLMGAIIFISFLGLSNQLEAQMTVGNAALLTDQSKESANFTAFNTEWENTLFVPNTFTPNGDGKNDQFAITSQYLKRFSMRIFDDKGEEVFATSFMSQGWDGTHYGREMQQSVYLYRIEATYLNDAHEVLVGHLNLIR